MTPSPLVANAMFGDTLRKALSPSLCAGVGGVWPGSYVTNAQDARMNPPLLFRRALKVVNGSNLKQYLSSVPCPGTTVCGLTVVLENPVYVQGDYNANSGGLGFTDPHVGSAVIADAVALLSNKYNDLNTFSAPYNLGQRNATTTWYRVAILSGKGPGFPWVAGTSTDFGSDGGMHNFLRYIENWGGQTLNLEVRLSVCFTTARQWAPSSVAGRSTHRRRAAITSTPISWTPPCCRRGHPCSVTSTPQGLLRSCTPIKNRGPGSAPENLPFFLNENSSGPAIANDVEPVFRAYLLVHSVEMVLDRLFRQAVLVRDFFVGHSLRHQT